MSGLSPIFITGFDKGLVNNKKPFLLPEEAFPTIENAYTWRDRVKKREGLQFVGRLRRALTNVAIGNITSPGAGVVTVNIFTNAGSLVAPSQPNAQIELGSITPITITVGGFTLTDTTGTGILTFAGIGPVISAYLVYATGDLVITFSGAFGPQASTFTGAYYPDLPVMGIKIRELSPINDEQTIFFDTKYAYAYTGTTFTEFIPGTTWNGSDSDFFWTFNYQGATAANRLFFATNFKEPPDTANPMRYTDGLTWTDFIPLVTATQSIFQARIIISYYGRLLLLNTYEGVTAAGPAASVNFFNRCRFSQYGDATAADAFRTDIFGKGGLIDAPTNEAIINATFVKNTLIVFFEETTWQLRYVGEYGFPFVWERVSADFGSESTNSIVLFDNRAIAVGDTAIVSATSNVVERIDLQIPDQVFQFKNANNGVKRIQGIRDYQRELVFWNYPDAQTMASNTEELIFPNKVLVYNYRNGTYAIFRDNVTAFGTLQLTSNVTWDSTTVTWDDEDITWDDFDSQSKFPSICIGNQQGYIHLYGYKTPDDQSLKIQDIDLTGPVVIISHDHNLQDGEVIYIQGMLFIDNTAKPLTSTLNNALYGVRVLTKDTFVISQWDTTTQSYAENFTFSFDPATAIGNVTYIGNGEIILFPRLNIFTKDINIYQNKGLQTKLSFIDFLVSAVPSSAQTINLFINTSQAISGNLLVGNKNLNTSPTTDFYPPAPDYAWFRFYATLSAQYFAINITYNNDLMNTLATHGQSWELYAINAFCRPGGRTQLG